MVIAEDLLRKTGNAMLTGDFDLMRTCFLLPQAMGTIDGQVMIRTDEELRSTFETVRAYYKKIGVTALERRCFSARFKSEDTVESIHEAQLMSGDTPIRPPYRAVSVLRRTASGWAIAYNQYAITDSPEHNAALVSSAE